MLSNMIRDADIGIDRIKVAERNTQVEDIPSEIREGMPEKILKSFLAHKAFSINAIHHVTPSDAEEEFDFMEDESNGTKRFFALAGVILVALKTGRTMVVDEIECSMHPNLVRKLVELFQSPKANNKGAQLIFATHDSTLMDQTLLRRDQIWLVEKNKNGASQLRSLYDFAPDERPRNTEAFQRNYLAGRYGGVPKFGPIFEDFELK
jgi:AAA15 family ATPase/GTPase